jgi:Na+-driven multidrug efflux pump
VAFGLVYALSGAVGPILAQNLGAGQYRRVQEGLRDSLLFMVASVAVAWLVLALGQGVLIRAFSAEGQAAELIALFCTWLAASFFFSGGLFVANASFNNLGHPLLSTFFNWGRATLGTIPFAWWGSHHGAAGVLIGQAVGSSIFGLLAVVVAFRLAAKLARQEPSMKAPAPVLDAPVAPTSAHGDAAALATPQPVAVTGPAASAAAP